MGDWNPYKLMNELFQAEFDEDHQENIKESLIDSALEINKSARAISNFFGTKKLPVNKTTYESNLKDLRPVIHYDIRHILVCLDFLKKYKYVNESHSQFIDDFAIKAIQSCPPGICGIWTAYRFPNETNTGVESDKKILRKYNIAFIPSNKKEKISGSVFVYGKSDRWTGRYELHDDFMSMTTERIGDISDRNSAFLYRKDGRFHGIHLGVAKNTDSSLTKPEPIISSRTVMEFDRDLTLDFLKQPQHWLSANEKTRSHFIDVGMNYNIFKYIEENGQPGQHGSEIMMVQKQGDFSKSHPA